MSIFNSDDLLVTSFTSHDTVYDKIPDIYELTNFKESNEIFDLRFLIVGKKVQNIFFDGIEMDFYEDEENYYSFFSIDEIFTMNNIYNNKKYMYLQDDYLDIYCTTDINSSSSITLDSRDIVSQRIKNKTLLKQIMAQEIDLQFNLQSELDTDEKYLNINIRKWNREKNSNLGLYVCSCCHSNTDNFITFTSMYNLPVYIKLRMGDNKREFNTQDNLLNVVSECKKIKNIILPLQFSGGGGLGEVICEVFTEKKNTFRVYISKIIFPNNEIVNYREKCQLCKKSKLSINIFNEYDSLCSHMSDKITFILKRYRNFILIKMSDLIEHFDYDSKYYVEVIGKDMSF